jgi:hypothetical protein
MTIQEARTIIAEPASHDDADIRAAAALLQQHGTPEEVANAKRFLRFGLRHNAEGDTAH